MAKVIAIIRTSTVAQEIESQRNEVINWILKDGYDESDIMVIGKQGASAIKLDDAYIMNLNALYKAISEEPIQCVYAWAIDRIGRNEEILMRLKNELINRKINLKIKNPSLTLLNPDGTANKGIELAFSLFATLSAQEMQMKQERFKRAKEYKASHGKAISGIMRFGYKKDEHGYIVINEDEAKIVRIIFDKYSTDCYSCKSLAVELNSMGYTVKGKRFNIEFVRKLLSDKRYIGEDCGNVFHTTYEPIIDKETFYKCYEILEKNKVKAKSKESKHINLAIGLLRCQCGSAYGASEQVYICYRRCKQYFDINQEKCPYDNSSISIKYMDYAIWWSASYFYSLFVEENAKTNKEKIEKENEESKLKIEVLTKEIDKYNVKKKRATNAYIDGDLTDKEYKDKLNQIESNLEASKERIKALEEKIKYNIMLLEDEDSRKLISYLNSIKETDLIEKRKIVKLVVAKVELIPLNNKEKKIIVHSKSGLKLKFLYNRYAEKKIELIDDEGRFQIR